MWGPETWGDDWAEVERWFLENLRVADERAEAHQWRLLLAHSLRQQLSHLSPDVPPDIAAFLNASDDITRR